MYVVILFHSLCLSIINLIYRQQQFVSLLLAESSSTLFVYQSYHEMVRTNVFVYHVILSWCPCVCGRDKSKNNTQIYTKLSTQVETPKTSDEFEDGQNPSSSFNFIAGYLIILVRFSIEIYIKMLKYQLFRCGILFTSKIQVKNSLGLLSNVAYVVLYKLSEYQKRNI